MDDLIRRQDVIDKVNAWTYDFRDPEDDWAALKEIKDIPSAQPEQSISEWQKDFREYINMLNIPRDDYNGIMEYINDVPSAQPATNCSEFPNTSDFVIRKAVREMVATWSYDMAEWEDVELALSDVDKLPSAHPEVIHCKDCKHYRTTGAFGVPLHKEEYFCDADNYPKNDPGEEQRELPEWWFCAGARRKENE